MAQKKISSQKKSFNKRQKSIKQKDSPPGKRKKQLTSPKVYVFTGMLSGISEKKVFKNEEDAIKEWEKWVSDELDRPITYEQYENNKELREEVDQNEKIGGTMFEIQTVKDTRRKGEKEGLPRFPPDVNTILRKQKELDKKIDEAKQRINFGYENMGYIDVGAEKAQQSLLKRQEELQKQLKELIETKYPELKKYW